MHREHRHPGDPHRLGEAVTPLAFTLTDMSFPTFAIAVALWAVVAMGVFHHANKRGNSHATAWGVATFLATGIVVPFYFIRYWLQKRSRDL